MVSLERRVELVPAGANYTVSVLTAHNSPCVIMKSDVATSEAVKCWGSNGYGSLGVVSTSSARMRVRALFNTSIYRANRL